MGISQQVSSNALTTSSRTVELQANNDKTLCNSHLLLD